MIEESATWLEKRLSPREREVPEAVTRMISEASLLERLGPIGIGPRLLGHGRDARGPWHRVERLPMPTLAQRIERGGALDRAWVERATAALLRAFAALHEATDEAGPLLVVHADPSPANLAVDDAGDRAVLLDFDLAWWRESHPPSDGAFRGTIAYAAPEVARGERPTVQSDLYSLGASLLHALTGTSPRIGDSFAALLARAAEEPLVIPAAAPAQITRLLEFDPSARPASARGLLC